MSKLLKIIALVAIIFIGKGIGPKQNPAAQESRPQVQVFLDEDKVETGQIFTYSIVVKGDFDNPQIKEPSLGEFKIVSTQSSRSFAYRRQKAEVKIEITYLLLAPKAGTFTIGPVKVSDAGENYRSETVEIKVEGQPWEEKRELPPHLGEGIEI